MATSIFIARLLGPVVLVVAIPMLASPKDVHEAAGEFLKSNALIFVTGVLVLVGGLAIVNSHNVWVMNWPVIITLFGWAMVIGGAARVAWPRVVKTVGRAMMNKPALTRGGGAVWALIGAYLTYQGYF